MAAINGSSMAGVAAFSDSVKVLVVTGVINLIALSLQLIVPVWESHQSDRAKCELAREKYAYKRFKARQRAGKGRSASSSAENDQAA